MKPITALSMARTWIGLEEIEGPLSHPLILAALQLDARWPKGDDVPWCSGFLNLICKQADLPRSKSLAARSWLLVGEPVARIEDARPGFDVIVFKRGGGNQGDMVSEARFPRANVIGVRRLAS